MSVCLNYSNKKNKEDILDSIKKSSDKCIESNLLIHGDNLNGLTYLLEHGYENKIDLCYIDPPYNTGRIFKIDNKSGETRTVSNTNEDIVVCMILKSMLI